MLMRQLPITRFVMLKGLHARALATEPDHVYHADGPAFPPVRKWCNGFAEGRTVVWDDPRSRRTRTSELPEAITSKLKERACFSGKVICGNSGIAETTNVRIQHENLDMKFDLL
jgi:hypothetical protein